MAQTNSIPEFKTKLAKHIRDMVDRVANEFEDLEKRERVREGLLGMDLMKALGDDEQGFTMNPPGVDMGTFDPVGQGTGVPPGQMDHDPKMDGGTCPLCHQADAPGSCQCLAALMGKNEMGAAPSGMPAAPGAGPMAMSEGLCKSCGKSHTDACKEMEKDEANPGANKDPSKQQPTKPVPGAELPPDKGGEKVKSGDDNKVKENGLGKTAVPAAKPPSGKVPGQQAAPIASNTSTPGLNKGALSPQMKQHAMIDASKQAAGQPGAGANPATQGVGGAKALTNPNDMSRANNFAAAQGGAFQPSGPVNSGLDLARPAAGKVAPTGLKPPTSAARSVPNPKAAVPAPKPGLFGKLFGKSEKCVFCNRDEHPGMCPEAER